LGEPSSEETEEIPVTDDTHPLGFQGTRLHLELDQRAAIRLRDALERAIRNRADSAPVQRLSWRLPDGRSLDVSVRLAEIGEEGDEDAQDIHRAASGDVSGDFAIHAAACGVIAVATQPYPHMPRSPQEAAAHDQRRINDALDRHVPAGNGAGHCLRDDIRERAITAADTTRPRRLAEAARSTWR
jgi:hypothetical protein